MIIYEVENFSGDEPAQYFGTLKDAREFARSSSASYEPTDDDDAWMGFGPSESELYRFNFHPSKENVIAALNRMHWRPTRELIAAYYDGKEVKE